MKDNVNNLTEREQLKKDLQKKSKSFLIDFVCNLIVINKQLKERVAELEGLGMGNEK